eukprot:jgi/Mesen1/3241/ME000187S02415
MLKTPLCDVLGIEYPIICNPLGPDLSGPELVAAVSEAGGLGILRAPDQDKADVLRALIRQTRELTEKPFGVGVVLSFPHAEAVRVILEERVAVLQVYWGEYRREDVEEAHRHGVKVIHQVQLACSTGPPALVGSVEDASKAAAARVDVVEAQGYEAGGHVIGQDKADVLRALIRQTRELTEKPFGVGVVLSFPHAEAVRVILEERVAVLQVYWGEYRREDVEEAHRHGVKVIHQVGSVEDASKAAAARVDVVEAQGYEAGGHVIGQVTTMALVPRVVDAVGPRVPVVAAGGIADGRGVAAALALGAHGVALGTRFVATAEANAHVEYKERLLAASESATVYTDLFGRARWPDAPHRVLQTPLVEEWRGRTLEAGDELQPQQPRVGHTTIYGVEKEVARFSGTAPNAATSGDIGSMVLYAGQAVGLVHNVEPAGSVVRRLVEEAQHVISRQLPAFVTPQEAS